MGFSASAQAAHDSKPTIKLPEMEKAPGAAMPEMPEIDDGTGPALPDFSSFINSGSGDDKALNAVLSLLGLM